MTAGAGRMQESRQHTHSSRDSVQHSQQNEHRPDGPWPATRVHSRVRHTHPCLHVLSARLLTHTVCVFQLVSRPYLQNPVTHTRMFVRDNTMTHWFAQPSLGWPLQRGRRVRLTEGVVPGCSCCCSSSQEGGLALQQRPGIRQAVRGGNGVEVHMFKRIVNGKPC